MVGRRGSYGAEEAADNRILPPSHTHLPQRGCDRHQCCIDVAPCYSGLLCAFPRARRGSEASVQHGSEATLQKCRRLSIQLRLRSGTVKRGQCMHWGPQANGAAHVSEQGAELSNRLRKPHCGAITTRLNVNRHETAGPDPPKQLGRGLGMNCERGVARRVEGVVCVALHRLSLAHREWRGRLHRYRPGSGGPQYTRPPPSCGRGGSGPVFLVIASASRAARSCRRRGNRLGLRFQLASGAAGCVVAPRNAELARSERIWRVPDSVFPTLAASWPRLAEDTGRKHVASCVGPVRAAAGEKPPIQKGKRCAARRQ